jgi:hypothetical protein
MMASGNASIDFDRPKLMPRDGKRVREVLKGYLRARRDAGFSFVSSTDIRQDLNWDPMPQKIGANLRELGAEGVVEKWTNTSPATYKILIGGG